jgi:cytochrome c biogenesis protein CcmG, thiol:disulfide interchange protein DsbE
MGNSFKQMCRIFLITFDKPTVLVCYLPCCDIKNYSMKKILLLVSLVSTISYAFSQDEKSVFQNTIPAVDLKDVSGKTINTGSINNHGNPIIISFWATWCSPCKKELNTIHDDYEDWVEETGVKLIAVSIDDERTRSRVAPYVDSKGWEYDVLLDPNGEFKRAMGVNNVPHTFVIDGTGKIVYSHNNYAPGDEDKLYKAILDLAK